MELAARPFSTRQKVRNKEAWLHSSELGPSAPAICANDTISRDLLLQRLAFLFWAKWLIRCLCEVTELLAFYGAPGESRLTPACPVFRSETILSASSNRG